MLFLESWLSSLQVSLHGCGIFFGMDVDKDTGLQLRMEIFECRAQIRHLEVQREPDSVGMSCRGTPKHLAQTQRPKHSIREMRGRPP